MHERGASDGPSAMSPSTEDIKGCCKVANNTLIEILSRTIARIDELESTMQQMVSIIHDIKQ